MIPKCYENPPIIFFSLSSSRCNRQSDRQINRETAVKTAPPLRAAEVKKNKPFTGAGGYVDGGIVDVVVVVGIVHVRLTSVFFTRLRLVKLTA